jgi:photosystem II stability/assembly factor-like uncharacterized protein
MLKLRPLISSLVVLCAAHNLLYPQSFAELNAKAKARLEQTKPDGTSPISKQLRRWEWFWESRQGLDGSMPSSLVYEQGFTHAIRAQVKGDRLQTGATWRETGPTGPANFTQQQGWFGIGRVNCIAFSNQNASLMFAGSAAGGIWRTTNSGQLWTEVVVPTLPIFGVADIAIAAQNDRIIYVATGDANGSVAGDVTGYPAFTHGVIKSTDGGATWARTSFIANLSQQLVIGRLWIHPTNPDLVVAATSLGIQRTTDGGQSWRTTTSTVHVRDIVQHPSKPNVLYGATFNFAGTIAVLKSTDAGESWRQVTTLNNTVRARLAVSPHLQNSVWMVTSATQPYALGGVYQSINEGETYTKLNVSQNLLGWSIVGNDFNRGGQGWYDLAMAVSPTNSQRLTVGGVNNWRSESGGTSWQLLTEQNGNGAPFVHADQHFLTYHPSTRHLYACHDGGISVSTNDGISWRDLSTGLRIQQFYGMDVAQTNSTTLIAGSQDNATYIRTIAGGRHVIGGDGMKCKIDPTNASVMYASIYYGQYYRSTNGGMNFAAISSREVRGELGAWVTPISMSNQAPSTIYLGYQNVWKSTNRGGNWSRISNLPPSASSTLRALAVAPSSDNFIYASYSDALYYTSNGGTSWSQVRDVSEYISSIAVDPASPSRAFVTIGSYNSPRRVLQVENGNVVDITGTGLPPVPVNTIVIHNHLFNRLIVGTDVGVYFMDNASGVWEPYGRNMPTTIVTELVLAKEDQTLFASTYGRGIWEIDATQCIAATPAIQRTPSSSQPLCAGDSVILTAPSNYESYRWSNGDTTRSIVLSTLSQSGEYIVNVTDKQGCRASSLATTVEFLRAPGRPSISRRGDTLRSSVLGGVIRWQWRFRPSSGQSAVDIPGATQREHVPTQSGLYSVLVFNENSCSALSNETEVSVTSIAEGSQNTQIVLSPNPTSALARLSWNGDRNRVTSVDVVSIDGRLLLHAQPEPASGNVELDLSSFARGTYLVRVTSPTGVWVRPIIRD